MWPDFTASTVFIWCHKTPFLCIARVITTVIRHISVLQLFPLCAVIVIHQWNVSIPSAQIVIIPQLGVIELGTRRGASESNQPHCSDLCLSQHHCYGGRSTWLKECGHTFHSHFPTIRSQSFNFFCHNAEEGWLRLRGSCQSCESH